MLRVSCYIRSPLNVQGSLVFGKRKVTQKCKLYVPWPIPLLYTSAENGKKPHNLIRFPNEPLHRFWNDFTEMFLICLLLNLLKQFRLSTYYCFYRFRHMHKNLKRLLLRNHCMDFKIIHKKYSLYDPLLGYRDLVPQWIFFLCSVGL